MHGTMVSKLISPIIIVVSSGFTQYPNFVAFFAENNPGPVLDFGPERGSAKGTMADLRP